MWINRRRPGCLALPFLLAATLGQPLLADAPLSAIDWLSQSVATPATLPRAVPLPAPGARAPTSAGVPAPNEITVAPLGRRPPAALGLVTASRSGLPLDIWTQSQSGELARLVRAERPDALPAVRGLLYTLLLAEFSPPRDGDPQNALFLARIDKLLDMGALDPALALLEMLEKPDPESFRRWFDVSLLVGEEERACRVMSTTPQIAPTFPARIFCLARGGDWNAAALSLRTGTTLGTIEPAMDALLARFLDPDLFEGEADLPPPERPSPLVLRLMEAIGQPMATATLPVAFAQADLRSNSGWKARIEAGERLARTGAIPSNRLLGLYSEQKPAASGGVWERVRGVQAVEAALAAQDADAASTALPPVWAEMQAQELEVPFAQMFGARLASLGMAGDAGALAFRIGLLSDSFEQVAMRRTAPDEAEAFLIGIARGEADGLVAPDQMGVAIQTAFAARTPALDENTARLLTEKRLGEALLKTIDRVTMGASGDLRDVTGGLALLRHVGLEKVARQAALELLILERRG